VMVIRVLSHGGRTNRVNTDVRSNPGVLQRTGDVKVE
jgi:hypothetical protein